MPKTVVLDTPISMQTAYQGPVVCFLEGTGGQNTPCPVKNLAWLKSTQLQPIHTDFLMAAKQTVLPTYLKVYIDLATHNTPSSLAQDLLGAWMNERSRRRPPIPTFGKSKIGVCVD